MYIFSNVYEGIGYSVNKPPILDKPIQPTGPTGPTQSPGTSGTTGPTGPISMPFTAIIIPTGPISTNPSSSNYTPYQGNPTPTSNTQPPITK